MSEHCPYKSVEEFAVATIYYSVIMSKFTLLFAFSPLQKIDTASTTNVTLHFKG